jgi:hypothetical protein
MFISLRRMPRSRLGARFSLRVVNCWGEILKNSANMPRFLRLGVRKSPQVDKLFRLDTRISRKLTGYFQVDKIRVGGLVAPLCLFFDRTTGLAGIDGMEGRLLPRRHQGAKDEIRMTNDE